MRLSRLGMHSHGGPWERGIGDADRVAGVSRDPGFRRDDMEGAMGVGCVPHFHRTDGRDYSRRRGSMASRKPSPTRLKAVTVMKMARPGKVTSHHAKST